MWFVYACMYACARAVPVRTLSRSEKLFVKNLKIENLPCFWGFPAFLAVSVPVVPVWVAGKFIYKKFKN